MLKFFRKYNKIILVIGGAFLMVSFLLMDSIGRMSGQLGLSQGYARIDGEKIDVGRFQDSIRELEVVRRVAPEVLALIGIDGANLTDHWFLLTYEAEKNGLLGGPGDGGAEFIETAATIVADREAQQFAQQAAMFGQNAAQFIAQRRAQAYQAMTEQMVMRRTLAIQQGNPERAVDLALAKMRSIIRLLESQPGSDTLSRPEALEYASELFDTAVVKVGVIPANATDPTLPEATEEEILAHFETYKEQRVGDNELGMGYLLEPAVRIEFVSVERQTVIDALRPTVDEIEVNKYWRENKARFGEDWSAAKGSATTAYVQEKADEVLDRVVRIAQREMRRVTRNLERDGKYYVLPSDWDEQMLPFTNLIGVIQQEISTEFGFDMPVPGYTRPVDNFLDQRALQGLRGLGGSSWSLNETTRVPFPQLMMNVRSLGGSPDLGLQENVAFGPLRSPTGVYFVRVREARGEGAPAEIDEDLRRKIVADIRAIKQFEDLKANAENFRSRLVAGNFDDVFREIAPDASFQNVEVTRRDVARPGQMIPVERFDTASFRDTIMDRVQQWDPLVDVMRDMPVEDRVFVIPLPNEKTLVAALVTARHALTYEEFYSAPVSIRAVAMEKRVDALDSVPFSLESLKKRLKVEFLDRSDDDEDKAAAEGDGADESADDEAAAG